MGMFAVVWTVVGALESQPINAREQPAITGSERKWTPLTVNPNQERGNAFKSTRTVELSGEDPGA